MLGNHNDFNDLGMPYSAKNKVAHYTTELLDAAQK